MVARPPYRLAASLLVAFSFGAACVVLSLQPVELWLAPILLLPIRDEGRLRRYLAAALGLLFAVSAYIALGARSDGGAFLADAETRARARHHELMEKGPWVSAFAAGWTSLALRDHAVLSGEAAAAGSDATPLADARLPTALVLRLALSAALVEPLSLRLSPRTRLRAAGAVWGGLALLRLL